jgi:RNase adapter protein RapZ
MNDDIIILTGMSGAGKSTAIFAFEEMRYQCMDNPPVDLFPSLFQLLHHQTKKTKTLVSVTLYNAAKAVEAARAIPGLNFKLICLVASETDLLSRYKLTRHLHPMQAQGLSLSEAMANDIKLVNEIRPYVSVLIDNTGFSVTQFRQKLLNLFKSDAPHLTVGLISFGFKHGIPVDADMVLDLRLLKNPFYESELRMLTGLDAPVRDYVQQQSLFLTLLTNAQTYLASVVPQLIQEKRPFYTIAIGCTGGRHRSIVFAEALAPYIQKTFQVGTMILHRDVQKNADQE